MFQKVEQAQFIEGEHQVLHFWREQEVFRRLQEQNRGKPKWSFLDGPITANNPMGVHHAWGRTYKDAFQRYYAMTGHELRYQNGFDCQGLWVEVEVEKQLNLGTKRAIEEYGIDVFTRECKRRVLKFAARQTEQSVRLGYWMEWDDPAELRKLAAAIDDSLSGRPSGDATVDYTNARGETVTGPAESIVAQLGNPEWGGSYFTFSTENNETIWTFLKKCFERKKIYRGHDVMPWGGRSGSAYSQMEVADGRRLTTHKSCFVRFPIIEKPSASGGASAPRSVADDVDATGGLTPLRSPENEYLLVWTTTPWTLTANVAAAVNPELEYVQVKAQIKGDDEPAIYYFAKENLNYKRLEKEFKEGFGRPEWQWPEGVPKLKTIAQIFKEQGGYEELGTVKGEDMIGWRYAGPFDDLAASQSSVSRERRERMDQCAFVHENVFDLTGNSMDQRATELRQQMRQLPIKVTLDHSAEMNWWSEVGEACFRFLEAIDHLLRHHAIEPWTPVASRDPKEALERVPLNLRDVGIYALDEFVPTLRPIFDYMNRPSCEDAANFLSQHSIIYRNIRQQVLGLGNRTVEESHRVIRGGTDSKGNPNVVEGEGTGIVHIAPGCGDIDHQIGERLVLPIIAPLEEDGTYDEGFGPFTGREAIDPATAELVFEKLREQDLLVYVETYPHIYPHCWRTGDELVFRLVDEWFINMGWREEIKEVTKTINWLPDSIQGEERELEWLSTMRDWMISKKRFWGLALPIWVDPDDPTDFEVIGSLAELKERALDGGEGWEEFEGHTPHRPWIDKVKIRSTKTGKLLTRVEDVGNPWLDAGIVPFSTLNYNRHYPESLLNWREWYPAAFVTECFPGQFRNWFYSLLALATMMRYDETDDPEQKRPFKNLLGHRLVMDEQGSPMHKSDGTAIWFEEAAEQLGVDTLRWLYLAHNPASDLRFGTRHPDEPVELRTPEGPITNTNEGLPTCRVSSRPADEIRRQILIPLWNSYAFFVNYAVLDEFDPTLEQVPLSDRQEIDRWILSRVQELTSVAHESFQAYNVAEFMRSAETFIDDLSNWYIRRNRRRFWKAKVEGSGVGGQGAGGEAKGEAHASEMSAFRKFLSARKLGLTRERTIVASEVFSSRDRFDPEQLLIRLSRFQKGKRISRSTVYRTLSQLEAAGLIRNVTEGEGKPLYELGSGGVEAATPLPPPGREQAGAARPAWETDKLAAYQTLYEVLVTLSKLLAPCLPFLSERMYRNLVVGEEVEESGDSGSGREPGQAPSATHDPRPSAHPVSVHLCPYPEVDESKLDAELNWKTQQVQTLVRVGHRLRETAELRVRQPLAELRFACADPRQAAVLEEYRDIIADELNVKQTVRAENLDELVSYSFKPNLKTLGPKYGKLLGVIRTELPKLDPQQLAPLRKGEAVTVSLGGEGIALEPEDVMVRVEQASDWASADDAGIQIALSTKLTPELIHEGMARDMIRHIQQLRKEADLEENQRISVSWASRSEGPAPGDVSGVEAWYETIRAETRADRIERVESPPQGAKSVHLGEASVELAIRTGQEI